MVIPKEVIENAFQRVLGSRLAPVVLDEVIDEFDLAYTVLGAEEAFRKSVAAKAPSVDPASYDTLFSRLESALVHFQEEYKRKVEQEKEQREQKRKEAKTEKEKKAAKAEEDALKAEVSAKTADFKAVQNDVRDINRDILAVARDARKLARDSGFGNSGVVLAALAAVEDITGRDGEVSSLVGDAGEIAKEVQEAARNGDLATIDGSIAAVEAIRDRLTDIQAVDIADAHDAVEAAITTAGNEKAAQEKEAAIKKAVDDSNDEVAAAEDIARQVKNGVGQYRLHYLEFYGKKLVVDPADVDNVDKLIERVNQAVTDAKAANARVKTAETAGDQITAETAAREAKAERDKAQAELDKLNEKVEALNEAKAERDTEKNVSKRKKAEAKEEAEEEKAKKDGRFDQFLSSMKGHAILGGAFLLSVVAVLLGFPTLAQVVFVIAALGVLTAYGLSWLKKNPERGAMVLGGYTVAVLVFAFYLVISLLIGKGPGSDRAVIPSQPTATATPTESAESDFYDYTPTPETESGD